MLVMCEILYTLFRESYIMSSALIVTMHILCLPDHFGSPYRKIVLMHVSEYEVR
jgi:hypothetical protein